MSSHGLGNLRTRLLWLVLSTLLFSFVLPESVESDGSTRADRAALFDYLLSKTNKLCYTTAYTYDDDGNMLTETDPLGNTTSYSYDSDGNMLTETDPLGKSKL